MSGIGTLVLYLSEFGSDDGLHEEYFLALWSFLSLRGCIHKNLENMSMTISTNAIPSFSLLYFDISIKSTSHWSSMPRVITLFFLKCLLTPRCRLYASRLCNHFLIFIYSIRIFHLALHIYTISQVLRNFQHWQDCSIFSLNNPPKTC